MSNGKLRQELESRVIRRIIRDALAVGYSLGVDDGGEEHTLERCKDFKEIVKHLMLTDEDFLLVYDEQGRQIGWVRLIYGNDGWDVVNDYTVNLEHIMKGAEKIADRYS